MDFGLAKLKGPLKLTKTTSTVEKIELNIGTRTGGRSLTQ